MVRLPTVVAERMAWRHAHPHMVNAATSHTRADCCVQHLVKYQYGGVGLAKAFEAFGNKANKTYTCVRQQVTCRTE